DALDLAATARARIGLADARTDVLAVIRTAAIARPVDRTDLRSGEVVPELQAARETGPALVDRDLPVVGIERPPDRRDLVGRVDSEMRKTPADGDVGQRTQGARCGLSVGAL